MSEKLNERRSNDTMRQESILSNETTFNKCNKLWISGIVEKELEYSHCFHWEKFYTTRVIVRRTSGTEDLVPIIVSEKLISNILKSSLTGKYMEVGGSICSYNELREDGLRHLKVFVYAKTIKVGDYENQNENIVFLEGYICKTPNYRMTVTGRQITDLMVSVSRRYNKIDFIPCIAWGKNALYANTLKEKDRIMLVGRIQSRSFFKKGETRIVYEVSISELALVEDPS